MKRKLLTSLLCISIVATIFSGCGSTKQEQTNNVNVESTMLTETEITEVDVTETEAVKGTALLVLSKTTIKDFYQGDISNTKETIYEYDDKGRVIKETFCDKNTPSWNKTYEYSYDDNDNIIKKLEYDEHGKLDRTDEYEYDGNLLLKSYCTFEQGNKLLNESCEYDENNNLIKHDLGYQTEIHEYNDNVIAKTNVYNTYDGKNELLSETTYDKNGYKSTYTWYVDGEPYEWGTYEYDENGNLLKETSNNKPSNSHYWRVFEYDQNNNVIMSEHYYSDISYHERYENTYDENNRLIETKYYYTYSDSVDEELNFDWQEKYEYDEYGNKTITMCSTVLREEWHKSGDNYAYEYDENGNVLKTYYYTYNDTEPYKCIENEYITIIVNE